MNYQYAHFKLAVYKFPAISIISIFVPLWLLGLLNLFVFFQDNSLADRIASIATLTLAYIAFIPEINNNIPDNPGVLFIEILILSQTLCSFLCLIQSFTVRDRDF